MGTDLLYVSWQMEWDRQEVDGLANDNGVFMARAVLNDAERWWR